MQEFIFFCRNEIFERRDSMKRVVKSEKVGGYTKPPIGGNVLLDPGVGGGAIMKQGIIRP